MDQFKNPIAPKIERKQPVPSDFWYNFDNKMFKIRNRKVWAHNRKPPESAEQFYKLKTPVSFVHLSFSISNQGASKIGSFWSSVLGPRPSSLKVIKAMQDIQVGEFKKNRPEIRYNFMVGGDGVVYEGRGWKYRPVLPKRFFYNNHNSIYIGFIGNWEKVPPPKHLIELKDEVIKIGIEKQIIKRKHLQIALAFSSQYAHELNYHLS